MHVGLKGNVSEAEHPLLCEGTRRQKGELAVAMLVQYKDDSAKLARVSSTVIHILITYNHFWSYHCVFFCSHL